MFALVPVPPDRSSALLDRYCGQERLYHGLYHLAAVWNFHAAWRGQLAIASAETDVLLACSIAYHDCVYDARSASNESDSAEVWLTDSAGSRLSASDRQWVADAIRASHDHLADYPKHPGPVGTELRDWFLSLDLAMLAMPEDAFDLANSLVRLEYRHVPDAQWRVQREASLRRFLNAPVLFRHPAIRALCEAAARDNLARDVANFSSDAAELRRTNRSL